MTQHEPRPAPDNPWAGSEPLPGVASTRELHGLRPDPGGYGVPAASGRPGLPIQPAPGWPPHPLPGAPWGVEPGTGLPYSSKSKVVAGVLQLCLGGLGAGRFYKGDVGIGIAQLLVSVLTVGVGVIWPVVDGIVMLAGRPTDREGRPLHG